MRDGHEIVAGICGFKLALAFWLIFSALFPGAILDYDKVDRLQTEKSKYEKAEQEYTRHIYGWITETSCRQCHIQQRGKR